MEQIHNLIPERRTIRMKGQVGLSIAFIALVAVGAVLFVFTQLRAPFRVGELPDALQQEISRVQQNEKQSLEQLGIDIEGDLDVIHLAFGDSFTLIYNKDKEFVVVIEDPNKESEIREAVAQWFADRGVSNLASVNIRWHIKPDPLAFPD